MSGWIKLHRSLKEKSWAKKPEYLAIWVYLLFEAEHKKTEKFWNGKPVKILPGQLITGRLRIAVNTGVHESTVERVLKVFENEQQIEQQKTNTSRLITILNYKKYQSHEQRSEQQKNNKRTTAEQRLNTNKEEYKEYKEVKKSKGKFLKPTISEVENYIFEKGLEIPESEIKNVAAAFFDHFESNGWVVGKAKAAMKDWSASVRTWCRNEKKYANERNRNTTATGGNTVERVGRMAKSDIDDYLKDPYGLNKTG